MKQGSASTKTVSNGAYSVMPPSNFSYIEESICRCSLPLTRQSIPFLQSTNISYVVNLSGKKFDSSIVSFFEDRGVETKMILQEGESPPTSPVLDFEKWVASVLEIVLSKSCTNVVLMVGSADTFYDCLVIACMRRLQEWSYVSILGEFRHLTWPHKLFDFEQVVDQFHTSLVDITAATPEFLALHDNFKEEEFKLLERCRNQQNVTQSATPSAEHTPRAVDVDESEAIGEPHTLTATPPPLPPTTEPAQSEQGRIDNILKKLFFSPGNQVISEGTVYDASVSLINEKDEED